MIHLLNFERLNFERPNFVRPNFERLNFERPNFERLNFEKECDSTSNFELRTSKNVTLYIYIYIMSFVRSGQVRLGEVRSGQVRLGQGQDQNKFRGSTKGTVSLNLQPFAKISPGFKQGARRNCLVKKTRDPRNFETILLHCCKCTTSTRILEYINILRI